MMHKLYHFLGSIYFAVLLISTVTLFVIAGTFLEALSESHLYASIYTYNHPFFIFLLWMFFVNILFSALRRWPFEIKHIPFLITHCGLLMIIGGTLIKGYFGTQGSMGIVEGSGSHKLFLQNRHEILIESKDPQKASSFFHWII